MTRRNDPTLASLGEWGFLNRLLPKLRGLSRGGFVVPPGDDAAVLAAAGRPVLSIDGLTDGTHFHSAWDARVRALLGVPLGRALAWKLMGSCLSDLAAMGSTRDRWAMIYLGAPPRTRLSFLDDLYRGTAEAARRFDCALAGGDTVRAKELTLVAAVGGSLAGARALTRAGGRAGNLLCVAGTIGDAAAGLQILLGRGKKISVKDQRTFARRFFDVRPMFEAGLRLSAESGVRCGMDLSDSLVDCVSILCHASGVGAEVELEWLPLSPAFRRNFSVREAATGGEDYSLLFAAEPAAVRRLERLLRFSVIGRLTSPGKGVRFRENGRDAAISRLFEHFS